MGFKLPKLPYKYNALEPFIDEQTMILHHTKHHQAYVDNLNNALAGKSDLLKMDVERLLEKINSVPEGSKQAVINNAGGHANHSFFWKIMNHPGIKDKPFGEFLKAVNGEFGSFDAFKEAFSNRAMSLFGSGWVFLVYTGDKKIILKRHSFQNSPLMTGNVPLLGIDLWEHAYYLKYQNRKKEYIDAWWNVVNWQFVEENFRSKVS